MIVNTCIKYSELWNQFPSEIGCTPPLLNQLLIIMKWLKGKLQLTLPDFSVLLAERCL